MDTVEELLNFPYITFEAYLHDLEAGKIKVDISLDNIATLEGTLMAAGKSTSSIFTKIFQPKKAVYRTQEFVDQQVRTEQTLCRLWKTNLITLHDSITRQQL